MKRRPFFLSNFTLFIFFVLFTIKSSATQFEGKSDPKAMLTSGNARFTMLTEHVIRMEWSEDKIFEDHASLTFINRRLPVPMFDRKEANGFLEIKSGTMLLKYKLNSGKFSIYSEEQRKRSYVS